MTTTPMITNITPPPPSKVQPVVLPSIQEMLPDHPRAVNLCAPAPASSESSGVPACTSTPSSSSSGRTITTSGSSGGPAGKKNICPVCHKRFNLASSLRMHMDTHTGATAFRCPWPNCGREFNVHSNMRKHLRSHGVAVPGDRPSSPQHHLAPHVTDSPQQKYEHLRQSQQYNGDSAGNGAKVIYHKAQSRDAMAMHYLGV